MRIKVLFGAGGLGRQLLSQNPDFFDLIADDAKAGETLFELAIVPIDEIPVDSEIFVAISDPTSRQKAIARLARPVASFVAPNADIGASVEIGPGTIICSSTTLVGPSRIGAHFHCNFYSYISHDCSIGDYVTFAPHVCCNGNVTIGDGVYVGANASIRQGVTIGDNAVIGMGAVVVKEVASGSTVVGNPAKLVNTR